MESADHAYLQAFALEKFVSRVTQDPICQLFWHVKYHSPDAGDHLIDSYWQQVANGVMAEKKGFLQIGKLASYFPRDADAEDLDRLGLGSELDKLPYELRFFASRNWGDIALPHASSPAIAAARYGLFQATFTLAEEFDAPLVFNLQCALHDEADSCLDNAEGFDAELVWQEMYRESFVYTTDSSKQNTSRCIAGLMQLVGILSGFDKVFESSGVLTDGPDSMLADLLVHLLKWRLDLSNSRTLRRLGFLSNQFWDFCDDSFRQRIDFQMHWSRESSERNFLALLNNWKSRWDSGPPIEGLPRSDPRKPRSQGATA